MGKKSDVDIKPRYLWTTWEDQFLKLNWQIVAPPLFKGSELFCPQFSPQSETRFQAEHDVLVRACMRIFISLASVLYLFFVLWAVVQQDNSGLIKPVSINLGFVFVASVCYYMLFQQALFHGRRKSSCSCALLRAWG